MRSSSGGNIRIGSVSFATLLSIILLAVLSVLCVVTANAANATANRQAASSTELYAVDSMGQALLAAMDEELAASAAAGESAAQAAARIQGNTAELEARAAQLAGAQAPQAAVNLSVSLLVSDAEVRFSVTGPDGRTLNATATINDDLSYKLQSWKMSTTQTASGESLWSGTSATN